MSDYCSKEYILKDLCRLYFELNKKIDFVNIIINTSTNDALDILHDKYKEVKSYITLDEYKKCIKSTILMINNNYKFKNVDMSKKCIDKNKIYNDIFVDKLKDFEILNKVLIKYRGKSKIVEIPYGVNRLKYKCFYNNPYIEQIIIPSSVRYIDYLSFEKLPNLKEIYISKRVKYISDYAFGGCNYPLIKCEVDKKPDTWSKKWNYSFYALNIFKRKMKVLWSKTKK